ncbi:phosphotransacetylase family protein [Chroococcus sp. FPU101]|uniref:phosphotransacetylase family protein n=1 Tax=Chroococcus sp. FPU101 TaxID=1974212 RepID=UPI001A8C23A2|nr:phosphotransacetylase family protein [Chroococcus sp. FPU101]GFE71527.1 DRTGG domain protein [Chroococcus sp. FPU101]
MAKSTKSLLIGSVAPYSGKSGTIVGLAHQLKQQGLSVSYGKPVGTSFESTLAEDDVQFMQQLLGLSDSQVRSPLIYLDPETVQKSLYENVNRDYTQELKDYLSSLEGDICILEGAGSLSEGSLFNLSLPEIAQILDIPVLLVTRYTSLLMVDGLLKAKKELGDRLLGTIINDVPSDALEDCQTLIKPFLEKHQISVLGLLPKSSLLRSVSVRELAKQLKAEILCRPDRLDLMVESLTIGAMNVNAAIEYFCKGQNMAVITGGDRTDVQLAALETSTSCLILTGHLTPNPLILSRADYLEVPILSVDLDTLTTVEIVDQAFGKTRIQEPIKVQCIQQLMNTYFDVSRLLSLL